MKNHEIKAVLLKAIQEIAPEIELEDIDLEEDLRDACDLDSMDFLNYLIEIKKLTGVKITERDYPNVNTFKKMLAHLEQNIA
ncbi:phosphopantetheine-binding protein [Shewanella sediminis HAW-EB3]|uniref:Phosphopantetheine-binding protein n=1 Tax=Shewanella sediminis (strain HAW-EB3) TaxID=425104 RepID=A8FVB4_SHESH|nr:phosphopantetheine-binding protein [Shewanella sediminis]ABV36787.1 phosphopantetheine-binding protein [Shewanella sediminis HAW-EB3]